MSMTVMDSGRSEDPSAEGRSDQRVSGCDYREIPAISRISCAQRQARAALAAPHACWT